MVQFMTKDRVYQTYLKKCGISYIEMDGVKMGLKVKYFNQIDIFNEVSSICDSEIEFLLSQKDEMVIKTNCHKSIKLKVNGKILEQISIYLYEFYNRGNIKGNLINDVEILKYLQNKYELINCYFAYQQVIFKCHIYDSNKKNSENYFLITFNEVSSLCVNKD